VIQLINPQPFQEIGWLINLYIIYKLNRKTKKMYLCALGEDYYWVKSCIKKRFKYSALDNVPGNKRKYRYSLKFLKLYYKVLNDYCVAISEKIIPGLVDYRIAYEHFDKCTDVIPLPINKNFVTTKSLSLKNDDKIVIFHGWQVGKELKKGNYIFDRAIKKLQEKYNEQIEYVIVKNVPYDEYVKSFSRAHLFIDQCYSYDKGVNALLGMAAGKVVFSGFEPEAKRYYEFFDDKYTPLINAVPDEDTIFLQIEDLLLNKQKINNISAAAREFILRYHLSEDVADNFLNVWGYDIHD
ncbi:glycosyltransferase, partial [Escherichia coli]|nr:glycosyltransferase [Escherichia coli]EJK0595155.1 glycosyltransferase [Escherichia coli]EJV2153974.1 glycosyltransferase [Escherichia coli]EKB6695842.1 glycosyltransferase [Escherichia coli]HBA7069633.1 glycosyltransferase [Escherichia coli]